MKPFHLKTFLILIGFVLKRIQQLLSKTAESMLTSCQDLCQGNQRVYFILAVWWFKPFFELVSVGGYICIYLVVYSPEIFGGFGLEEKSEKTKAVCSLGGTNCGGLRNVRLPIMDPLITVTQ